jgi:hypothetical protein
MQQAKSVDMELLKLAARPPSRSEEISLRQGHKEIKQQHVFAIHPYSSTTRKRGNT